MEISIDGEPPLFYILICDLVVVASVPNDLLRDHLILQPVHLLLGLLYLPVLFGLLKLGLSGSDWIGALECLATERGWTLNVS